MNFNWIYLYIFYWGKINFLQIISYFLWDYRRRTYCRCTLNKNSASLGKKYDFPIVKSYYVPWGEIVFKTIYLFFAWENLNYQGNNLIFNNIIGGEIIECMYEIWCSPGLGKKIWFSKCKIIFFSLGDLLVFVLE